MTGVSDPASGHDPARAWATEHYGFASEQGPARPSPPAAHAASHRPSTPSRPRAVRLAVAGVLASVLVAGFGGAAIAAGAMDGVGDGDGNLAFDVDGGPDGDAGRRDDGDFGGFDGGSDGGFADGPGGGPGGGGGGR